MSEVDLDIAGLGGMYRTRGAVIAAGTKEVIAVMDFLTGKYLRVLPRLFKPGSIVKLGPLLRDGKIQMEHMFCVVKGLSSESEAASLLVGCLGVTGRPQWGFPLRRGVWHQVIGE